MQKFYVTTAIPYVNAKPHLGFALELTQADVLARYFRGRDFQVHFLTGTDDNALKNVLAAEKAGVSVDKFVKQNSEAFRHFAKLLNISNDDFISTREERHIRGAQKFWSACNPEDIYKKMYEGLYCTGCEEFKRERDLVNGHCEEHPTLTLETVREENYFFRLSAYADKLRELIVSGELAVFPESRRQEFLNFIDSGLEDFSISRSLARARDWGILVPGSQDQVMYVWFDALTNYITALGYADEEKLFRDFWLNRDMIVHVLGKGIARFHIIYWPAMLLSAGLPLPTTIFVHGYLTNNGQKISKTLDNGVDPQEVVLKYGVDAVRYFLLREIPAYGDGDFSEAKFKERYNADLANDLGNFAARVLTLGAGFDGLSHKASDLILERIEKTKEEVNKKVIEFKFHEALAAIFKLISFGDGYVNEKKPWEGIKMEKSKIKNQNEGSDNNKMQVLFNLIIILDAVAEMIKPFLPETAEKILGCIKWDSKKSGFISVKKGEVLFPRLL